MGSPNRKPAAGRTPEFLTRPAARGPTTDTGSVPLHGHASPRPLTMTVRSSQQPPMRSSYSPHLTSSQINRSVSRGIGQITRPASRGNQASNLQKQSPIFVSGEKWQRWVELAVRVSNLPPNITTWDLSKRFGVEGTIIFIEIYENRQGMREGIARIRFSPPPRHAFWAEDNITMKTSDGQGHFQVKAMLEPPRRSFKVPSPVRKSVTYDEVMSLRPSAIGFGFIHEELTMMRMHEVSPISRHDMKFTVDLLRSRIVVRFQVQLTDSTTVFSGIATDLCGAGRKDRVDSCMFTVPFARLQKVQRVEVDKDRWALIISLESPPEFFWKRPKIELSHSDGLVWSEFDTWARLTDVVYDPQALQGMVVALQNERAVIDIGDTFPPTSTMKELTSIGRWTTYRIIFNKGQDEPTVINDIQNALQDFNIEVVHLDQFQAVSAPLATTSASVWSLLDRGSANREQTEKGMVLGNRQTHRVLPFGVRYQLEVCVSQGIIDEHNIKPEFVAALVDLASQDAAKARHILEFPAEQERRIFEPMKIFSDKEALAYSPNSKIPPYCAYMRKATVTPTTIYYSTPTVETSNRVIREYAKYGDRFLRVQFTDEKSEGRINSCADKQRNDGIFTRVFRTLVNGIQIGDRHYEFLAFGNSQFRENGAYFFCPTEEITCDSIRHWMGDFSDIKVVAKYAARLGLCFSTTRAIHSSKVRIVRISDVERNGYCFTDGVGKISEELAAVIASELRLPSPDAPPSAYQFRLAGCKGILTKWPDVQGHDVHIRKSQEKFAAKYSGLEIIRWSRYSTATLNRQTITILSSLGVADEVFNRMLTEQLSNYQTAMTDRTLALNLLSRYIDDNHMTMTIATMVVDGFMQTREPFLLSLLHLWRAWSIKLLKEKARIIVENGAFLLGVTDETGTLRGHKAKLNNPGAPINDKEVDELPEIFLQVPDKNQKGRYVVIEGICLLGRNPSLFPGDIRVVRAVNKPALHHLRDVVVFSQLGDRDVPSMCSGGDLDGDDFFCIWDKDLTPTEWNPAPMDYAAPKARELDRPVQIVDLMRFFVRYMKNDALPTIAHSHLAQSDLLDLGVKDPKCIELATLHSKAVDYVKTGEPAELPKRLKPRRWPHFMEKKHKPKEQIYHSDRILGQLYDKVERVDFVPQYNAPFDRRILSAYKLENAVLKVARQLKTKYDTAVRRIMAQKEINTEFEVWTTFVMSKPRVGSDYKVQEEMANISGDLKDRFRKVCVDSAGGNDFEHLGSFVAAMYRITWEEMQIALAECRTMKIVGGREVPKRKMVPKYMPLISFPWLFHETLGRIATGIEQRADLEDLGLSFLPTTGEPKTRKIGSSHIGDLENDDAVETAEGIVHRGELLNIFGPDDNEEGDEDEQLLESQVSATEGQLNDNSGETALPQAGPSTISSWMDDLAFLESSFQQLPKSMMEESEGKARDEQSTSNESPVMGIGSGLIDTSVPSHSPLPSPKSEEVVEIEEVVTSGKEESPLEKLARLMRS